ncbi:hypothetical protein [uncultured Parabacteroides sp.]|nr:hypothetical protein [uncultured Parabacteroides sp.]
MNKKQMIQAIADKTFLEAETIKQVLDACEIILMDNIQKQYQQSPVLKKSVSHKEKKDVKIVQFPHPSNIKHNTN